MANVTIWHNPRCSKSRAALALLEQAKVEPTVLLYLENPPTASRIEEVLGLLGLEPRELMRTGESVYKELGLADPAKTRPELIQALVAHPILIERPVIITDRSAVVARPPERALEILAD
jgi:arsenate reductase (glutaredoxin)